jgi:ATP-dependent Clp protease ATP-binding subunit ClpA
LGDNIVVFDFIREHVADQIFDKMLSNIVCRVQREVGVKISLNDDVIQTARRYCTSDMTNGGRGIGNRLETVLINPLARELFGKDLKRGDITRVVSLAISDSSVKIQLA